MSTAAKGGCSDVNEGPVYANSCRIVDELQTRARALQPELEKIEARKREIETISHAANLSLKRLSSFQPEIDGNFQCPRCWVHHEARTSMLPVPGTDTEDFFKCHVCHFKFSLPA